MPQPPDLAQIKDWEMKKLLHFAFPDQELEVEWRFIFCERFPGLESPWSTPAHHAGEFSQSEKDFAQLLGQKYYFAQLLGQKYCISLIFLDSALLLKNGMFP